MLSLLDYYREADRGMAPTEMSALDKYSERREDGSASLQDAEVLREIQYTFSTFLNPKLKKIDNIIYNPSQRGCQPKIEKFGPSGSSWL